MKVTFAAVLAAATSVAAWGNVTYTTEIVTALTTYCPAPTEITHGGHTYTVTEATTLTITNCPCTVTKPVTTVSNSTAPPTESVVPTTAAPTHTAPPTVTAGAGKAAALSGGALAGVLGLAAFVL